MNNPSCAGDICGSGWQKKPGRSTVCALHTSPVPYEAIAEYWHGLPEDHRTALFRLREEDFCAELDAHLKYQLRVCRDCRGNVLKSFKELKPPAKRTEPQEPGRFEVCEGHFLTLADGLVTVDCEEETPANFFLLAEEVEDGKVLARSRRMHHTPAALLSALCSPSPGQAASMLQKPPCTSLWPQLQAAKLCTAG